MSLNIVVIGAGLGGLAAALSIKRERPDHDVLVVESAPVLAEVQYLTHGSTAVQMLIVYRSAQACS